MCSTLRVRTRPYPKTLDLAEKVRNGITRQMIIFKTVQAEYFFPIKHKKCNRYMIINHSINLIFIFQGITHQLIYWLVQGISVTKKKVFVGLTPEFWLCRQKERCTSDTTFPTRVQQPWHNVIKRFVQTIFKPWCNKLDNKPNCFKHFVLSFRVRWCWSIPWVPQILMDIY